MKIEQLRKDMEAGTQGDWWDDPRSTEVIVILGPHTKYVVADVEDIDDARRIARVPQLERIALAAEALSGCVVEMGFSRNHHIVDVPSLPDRQVMLDKPIFDAVLEALDAYREATK